MFAVPGWSVESSALQSQTQPVQSKNDSQPEKDTPNSDGKNNKRKRANDRVTAGNVDEMYRRHIEGTTKGGKSGAEGPVKSEKKQKKEKKEKQTLDTTTQEPTSEAATTADADADQTEEKAPKKRQRKNKKNKDSAAEDKIEAVGATTTPAKEAPAPAPAAPAFPPTSNLTPLQQAMRQKLISSRFRHLNETLYTTPSEKALEMFSTNPELFDEYHAGFARQVKESWPSNPVDDYIKTIRHRGAIPLPKRGNPINPAKGYPLPRRPTGLCTFADLGCGDAQLARALTPSAKKLKLKLNSYDLAAPDPLITKADISNLPLEDGAADVAIFCLSLMGTNWVSFVEEAWRILRGDGKGECWVSEVKSRFGKVQRKKSQIGAQKPGSKADKKKLKKKGGDDSDDEGDIFAEDVGPSDNKDETDISAFVEVFRSRGFMLRQESVVKSNKMFVSMVFVKQGGAPTKGKHASALSAPAPGGNKKRFVDRKPDSESGMSPEQEAQVLKPCVYKIR
ncbi:Methyltransferase-related protein [Penicillium coprophilum]|uniref:Methyltransferase-related protein n=1 Tax=Penicillium coprophilum TaxID=36646 RepID=UPI0023A264A1|nr:Methyltransferase-related protein [Penicillium coprophilum]KAJ5154772.1 Methyltransferase-related protein [Penicillium coprophilum]